VAKGTFGTLYTWPIIGIHAALLPNGDVFTFGTNRNGEQGTHKIYDIYDPTTGVHTTSTDSLITDEFCSDMALDPATGDMIIAGGDARPEGAVNFGVADVNLLDWTTNTLSASLTGHMNYPRWYPTLMYAGNGQFLVLGGLGGPTATQHRWAPRPLSSTRPARAGRRCQALTMRTRTPTGTSPGRSCRRTAASSDGTLTAVSCFRSLRLATGR